MLTTIDELYNYKLELINTIANLQDKQNKINNQIQVAKSIKKNKYSAALLSLIKEYEQISYNINCKTQILDNVTRNLNNILLAQCIKIGLLSLKWEISQCQEHDLLSDKHLSGCMLTSIKNLKTTPKIINLLKKYKQTIQIKKGITLYFKQDDVNGDDILYFIIDHTTYLYDFISTLNMVCDDSYIGNIP